MSLLPGLLGPWGLRAGPFAAGCSWGASALNVKVLCRPAGARCDGAMYLGLTPQADRCVAPAELGRSRACLGRRMGWEAVVRVSFGAKRVKEAVKKCWGSQPRIA